MLIVSYQFLLFLFVLLFCYYLCPGRFQWMLLLTASYAFYFLSGEGFYIIFVLLTTISTYLLARKVESMTEAGKTYVLEHALDKKEKKAHQRKVKAAQKKVLVIGLVLNFGMLAVIKYTNFMIGNINSVLSVLGRSEALSPAEWIFPLGISYYTFQAMGYITDVYRRKELAEKNLARFALFISFFPQLVMGPISRYSELKEQLYEEKRLNITELESGLLRVLWGFFKKLVIADRLAPAVAAIAGDPDTYTGFYVLLGMFTYAIQMYADFTGGIDVVLGVARTLGIRLPENFNRPFFSKSIGEFWRRWHMTLMQWFRDYIFFPVSTSRFCQKLVKGLMVRNHNVLAVRIPVYVASLAVWLVAGAWHGASWNFIIWGLVNCFVILLSQELTPLYRRFHQRFAFTDSRAYTGFQVIRTFFLFCVIEMFEYYPFFTVFRMLGSLFASGGIAELSDGRLAGLGLTAADWYVVLAGTGIMLFVSLMQRKGNVTEQLRRRGEACRFIVYSGLFFLVLILGVYGQGYDASQFIYNQF